MKKLLLLGLFSSLLLTACTDSQNEDTTANSTNDTSQSASKNTEETNEYLTSPTSRFPQLNTEVTEDEAQVILHTSEGDMTLKLFPTLAPLAVENFLRLSKEDYYKDVTFHRIITDFMIQSGDPEGTGKGGESIWSGEDDSIDSGNGFANEITPYLFNIRGALAMANAGPDTNGSQFFINQNTNDQSELLNPDSYPEAIIEAYKNGGNPNLDGDYTVFGQVISGMDVVDKIASAKTDANDKPVTEITITSIEIVKDYKFD